MVALRIFNYVVAMLIVVLLLSVVRACLLGSFNPG